MVCCACLPAAFSFWACRSVSFTHSLLGPRFADNILLFARRVAETLALLDDRVRKLQNIGLQLNAAETVISTSKVQPPCSSHTNNEVKLRVLKQQGAHKWIGCMISAAGHLQAVSRICHANKWILLQRRVHFTYAPIFFFHSCLL